MSNKIIYILGLAFSMNAHAATFGVVCGDKLQRFENISIHTKVGLQRQVKMTFSSKPYLKVVTDGEIMLNETYPSHNATIGVGNSDHDRFEAGLSKLDNSFDKAVCTLVEDGRLSLILVTSGKTVGEAFTKIESKIAKLDSKL